MIRFFMFLCIGFFSLNSFSYSENYYYMQEGKVIINELPGKFVVQFNNVSNSDKEELLTNSNLNIKFNKSHLSRRYIQIESSASNNEVKALSTSAAIKTISKLYVSELSNVEFTYVNRLLVRFKKDISQGQIQSIISTYDLKIIERKWLGENTFLFENSNLENTLFIANEIFESGLVEYSNPDFISFNVSETNDAYYSSQWNLPKILANSAWTITTGSSQINIAILDNGVQSNHPDLTNKLITGYNALEPGQSTNPTIDDDNGTDDYHGTACAGVAAAATNNGIGIAGIGYNSKIIPIKLYYDDQITASDAVEAINWAYNHDADVLNLSWTMGNSQPVLNAITDAVNDGRDGKGCVVVKSAGNTHGEVTFPGQHPKVLAVGATNENDNRWSYSCYGNGLDVMAPSGWAYNGTKPFYSIDIKGHDGLNDDDPPTGSPTDLADTDYTKWFDGTSAAAPQVAGLAALILSIDNSLTEEQVRYIICHTADDKGSEGWDSYYGWGRINAYLAVKSADKQFTLSGSLQNNECWWGSITLTDNVTVPDGKILTVAPGAVISIPNGKKIQVNGMLIANNATFQPASGATWYGIQFYNCSSNSEVIGCEITGSTYGLDMYYYSNVKLHNNDISLNTYGMVFSSYSDGNGGVLRNDIESNDYGVFCVNYSDPCLYETAFIDNDRVCFSYYVPKS
ncbi:MAG: S8 family serine peptidase [Planctomycetia bacterium]|nr:S8 family serine peptidase [Planctomycetia bacterium]